MPRLLIAVAALAAAGCYQSHHRGDGEAPGAASDAGPSRVTDGTHLGPDGLPVRCFDGSVQTIVVGPDRGCVRVATAPRGAAACSTLTGPRRGTPLRVVRAAVGRLDMRLRCDGACDTLGVSPDSCDGCLPVERSDGYQVPSFPDLQVDGLVELVVDGAARVEVCFDPEYGPPAWDD